MKRMMLAAVMLAMVAGGGASGAAGDVLTVDQRIVVEQWAAARVASMECEHIKLEGKAVSALVESVFPSDTDDTFKAAIDDYRTMRFEMEKSRALAGRRDEYCAVAWYRFGARGTVLPGLLKSKN